MNARAIPVKMKENVSIYMARTNATVSMDITEIIVR